MFHVMEKCFHTLYEDKSVGRWRAEAMSKMSKASSLEPPDAVVKTPESHLTPSTSRNLTIEMEPVNG